MTLVNKEMAKKSKQMDMKTKVCENPRMYALMKCFHSLGFFDKARKAMPSSRADGYVYIQTLSETWSYEKPGLHAYNQEEFKKRLDLYLKYSALFRALYNTTYYLVPLKVKDGRKYFLEQKKRLEKKKKGARK